MVGGWLVGQWLVVGWSVSRLFGQGFCQLVGLPVSRSGGKLVVGWWPVCQSIYCKTMVGQSVDQLVDQSVIWLMVGRSDGWWVGWWVGGGWSVSGRWSVGWLVVGRSVVGGLLVIFEKKNYLELRYGYTQGACKENCHTSFPYLP